MIDTLEGRNLVSQTLMNAGVVPSWPPIVLSGMQHNLFTEGGCYACLQRTLAEIDTD